MFKFRLKKISPEERERLENLAGKTVSTAGLALGIGNFALNQRRAKQDRKYHDSQLEATQRLTKALENDIKAHEIDLAARNLTRKVKSKPYRSYVVGDVTKKGLFRLKKRDDKV